MRQENMEGYDGAINLITAEVKALYEAIISSQNSRDSIVVSTSRCGRENPGSNPGHGRAVIPSWQM